ncbi:hypothetical protein PFY01_02840 [Brevundimonas vesicularis]|uniref:hypothetical protein n=1 Tax=Brevundimonas vesicularis TaxID=41276 RepID=UPI0022EC225A|nr:hypothetical protein [Brevundimonas vesicularis]WBT06631.1 hypothetical protein PFY01_02840 [Brevundimonas vesicularis]
MTLRLAASAVVVLFCLAGCDRSAQPVEAKTAPEASAPAVADATPPATEAPAVSETSAPAADGAPSFAVVYPGAQVDGQPLAAGGEAGPGGLITFTTSASPDDVVAFYRERAEKAGLRSVAGMNQGDTRAYGAAADAVNGASLQVVATPTETGETSVQLGWSAGQ